MKNIDLKVKKFLRKYLGQMVALVTIVLVLVFGTQTAEVMFAPESAANNIIIPLPTLTVESADSDGALEKTDRPQYDIASVPVYENPSIMMEVDPETYHGKLPDHAGVIKYTVMANDTPIKIADKFNIKPETILGGNPKLSEEAGLLQVGRDLPILPIDGVLHDVHADDTIETIAEQYNVSVEEIIAYLPNNLEFPYRLYPGTQILVPDAVREVFQWDPPVLKPAQPSNPSTTKKTTPSNNNNNNNTTTNWVYQAPVTGSNRYVWPVYGSLTQVFWAAHPAIDIGVGVGTPVYAADGGTVTYAAWSPYCYGNLVVINHGNGSETLYAHLSSFNAYYGKNVRQGALIGYSGNTGCSTGPHLHFEIRVGGRRYNPLGYLP